MNSYSFHVLRNDHSGVDGLVDLYRQGFVVSEVTFIELEPGDDSTDPGGVVSLAELGYKKLGGPMSLDNALRQPLPDRPFCLALNVTESEYQERINTEWQSSSVKYEVGCLCYVRGMHQLQGVVHSLREIDGEWRLEADGGYRVVRAETSIEVSGEGEGDRIEIITSVLMHPHTQQALRTLKTEQIADLSIVF